METKILKVSGVLNIEQVLRRISNIGLSISYSIEKKDNLTSILVEKYFMRNNNVACCSISVYSNSVVDHDIIVMSGASAEGLLNITWGADKNFITSVCEAIESN